MTDRTAPQFANRPLAYLAGPYSTPDPVCNTNATIKMAEWLMRDWPITVHVPHLTLAWQLVSPHSDEWWYAYDLAVLERCDALIRLPGMSAGAAREVAHAKSLDIPVFDSTRLRDPDHDLLAFIEEWEAKQP